MFSLFRKKPLLSPEIQKAVAAAIAAAEQKTMGEIRVFVESHCALVDPLARCEEVFVQLNMHQTAERNGVLLYIALKDRQFAIAGDKGINDKVGGNAYWEQHAATLKSYLAKGYVQEAICNCVTAIGASLATHYPLTGGQNTNELPDEIVFGQ